MNDVDQAAPSAPAQETSAAPRVKRPTDYGPKQVLWHTGLTRWQWEAAEAAGLIPPPDNGNGRWSAAAADEVAGRRDAIVEAVGSEAPIGGHKAAARLVERTGLPVEKPDVEALAAAGVLDVARYYKGWPLWDCGQLDSVEIDQLGSIVAERQAWIDTSVSVWDAPGYLGWRRNEFERVAKQRGLVLGRFDRYAKADLDALGSDEDLAEQVRLDRLLIAHQAAEHLEIRDTDFRYLLAADLVAPRKHTSVQVSRYREVDVPLYRVGDLEALHDHPDIDWEAVRSVKPGEPSPLRYLARRPIDRAAVIRRGIAELGDRYDTEVWAWWNNAAGVWEVDYERRDGGPSVKEFKAAIAEHRTLRDHIAAIDVATEAGAAIRWARAMREPGAAVILDTETTDLDGYIVEVAVVDACTGETLLDTLVNPMCPVQPGAYWVHGISDEQLVDAPTLAEVLPRLLKVTRGRTVLAYNAGFDAEVVQRHARRDELDAQHLVNDGTWSCLMVRRSDWLMRYRWLPLGGGHRAVDDCQVAYDLLAEVTAPAHQPKALRLPR